LQEQSDLNAFKDLLGGDGEHVDLDTFEPKSAKDFESLAKTLVAKYVAPWERDPKFKTLLKALVKGMLAESEVQQVKDLESCLAGIRADKLKEEKAAAAAKKGEGFLQTGTR
jgi:translation initiation factor 3 subunit J